MIVMVVALGGSSIQNCIALGLTKATDGKLALAGGAKQFKGPGEFGMPNRCNAGETNLEGWKAIGAKS